MLGVDGQVNAGMLRSLALMYRYRIGEHYLIELDVQVLLKVNDCLMVLVIQTFNRPISPLNTSLS